MESYYRYSSGVSDFTLLWGGGAGKVQTKTHTRKGVGGALKHPKNVYTYINLVQQLSILFLEFKNYLRLLQILSTLNEKFLMCPCPLELKQYT